MALNLKKLALAFVFSTAAATGLTGCFEGKTEAQKEQELLDKEKANTLRIEREALARVNAQADADAKETALQDAFKAHGYTKVKFLNEGQLTSDGQPVGQNQSGTWAKCYTIKKINADVFYEGCLANNDQNNLFAVRMPTEERQRLFLEGQGYKIKKKGFEGRINSVTGEPNNNGVSGTCFLLEKNDDSTLHTGCVVDTNEGSKLNALGPLVRGLKVVAKQ